VHFLKLTRENEGYRNRCHRLGKERLKVLELITDADLYLCTVTLGEIQAGIEITREQTSSKQRR